MDHGHTNPELIVKSKEVEDVVAFYRQRSDLVLTSGKLSDLVLCIWRLLTKSLLRCTGTESRVYQPKQHNHPGSASSDAAGYSSAALDRRVPDREGSYRRLFVR